MERRLLQSKNQGNWKRRKIRLGALEKEVSKRIRPYEIIKKSVDYMNCLSTTKYKLIPNRIAKNTWSSEECRETFNFSRLKKISRKQNRLERFDKKIYRRKKLKLRPPLELGEEVLVLAARIKKRDSAGKFYKSSVDSKSYFSKEETFLITSRQKTDEKYFYWLKS